MAKAYKPLSAEALTSANRELDEAIVAKLRNPNGVVRFSPAAHEVFQADDQASALRDTLLEDPPMVQGDGNPEETVDEPGNDRK